MSSSNEVAGKVVLVALGTEVAGVIEVPFLMTCTTFFPRLERGSFYLAFILAYISRLNFFVIYKCPNVCVKKKKKKKQQQQKGENGKNEENLKAKLTFFFNLDGTQDEGRRLGTKKIGRAHV